MTIASNRSNSTFSDEDVVEALADPGLSFDYNAFLKTVGLVPDEKMPTEAELFDPDYDLDFQPDCDIPPRQWMRALMYRTLTPAEQLARERYFERRVNEALALVRKDHENDET